MLGFLGGDFKLSSSGYQLKMCDSSGNLDKSKFLPIFKSDLELKNACNQKNVHTERSLPLNQKYYIKRWQNFVIKHRSFDTRYVMYLN